MRAALDWAQVEEMGLPPALGEEDDPRAAAFAARHGRLVQVELDAVRPEVLRDLYTTGTNEFWDRPTTRPFSPAKRRSGLSSPPFGS